MSILSFLFKDEGGCVWFFSTISCIRRAPHILNEVTFGSLASL